MGVTYSLSGTITRATQFDRKDFRRIAMTSGMTATKEFSASFDLTVPELPLFPLLVVTPDISSIKFLCVQVTGGIATIRLQHDSQQFNNIDLPVSGTLVMSGIDLKQVYVLGTPSGSCYIEVFGMGT